VSAPHVVFLCTGNSARSQLAEALLRHHAQGRLAAHSAGTHPKGVHPLTLAVLHERGIDTQGLRSKQVAEVLSDIQPAYLIVVCDEADRNCPAGTAAEAERLFWPFPDPARATGSEEERLAFFRHVRDQIEQRILAWLDELEAAGTLEQDSPGGSNG
jgi:arsenate reductase